MDNFFPIFMLDSMLQFQIIICIKNFLDLIEKMDTNWRKNWLKYKLETIIHTSLQEFNFLFNYHYTIKKFKY
jgi:hypothetical protein